MGTSKKSGKKLDIVELVPDAWPRFEKFIREIVKAGPQHRDAAVKSGSKHKLKANAKPIPGVLSGAGKSKRRPK